MAIVFALVLAGAPPASAGESTRNNLYLARLGVGRWPDAAVARPGAATRGWAAASTRPPNTAPSASIESRVDALRFGGLGSVFPGQTASGPLYELLLGLGWVNWRAR